MLNLRLMGYKRGASFVPGTVPKVKSSTIPAAGDGILVKFDRPMTMTQNLQDAITVIINGAAPVNPDHVILSPDKTQMQLAFPAGHFHHTDVVTWAYNDQHPTEELKGAEPGGKEIDNQTYAVFNNAVDPAADYWVDENANNWKDENSNNWEVA